MTKTTGNGDCCARSFYDFDDVSENVQRITPIDNSCGLHSIGSMDLLDDRRRKRTRDAH